MSSSFMHSTRDHQFILKEWLDLDQILNTDRFADGYTVEISRDDREKGVVFKNSKGQITVFFEGLPKSTQVKDFLSIEGIE